MRILNTPWGPIEIHDVVPLEFECAKCGRCCRAFVLSMREIDRETWYRRFLAKSEYEYPKDIGAVYHLFEKILDAFSADGQQIYTCRAFDRKRNVCTLFDDAPALRPIACWAFPYNYDLDSLLRFPYPWCSIFLKTLRRLEERFLEAIAAWHHPFNAWNNP